MKALAEVLKVPNGWTKETWQRAMANANSADKNFVPLYIKNNSDVRKALYEIRKYKDDTKQLDKLRRGDEINKGTR